MKAEQFITSAQEHAQDAFGAKARGRGSAAALHLGVMLEHLAKAYLVGLNPAYIVDGKAPFDSLLVATGHAKYAKADTKIRTIGAKDALKRFAQLNPPFQVTPRLDQVIDARDGAAHAGDRAEDLDQLLHTALQAAQTILSALKHDTAAFWADYTSTVTTILTEHTNRVRATVQLRIDQASRDYNERFGQLDDQATAMLTAALESAFAAANEDSTAEHCPACRHTGLLTGRVDHRWEADFDFDHDGSFVSGHYAQLVLYPTKFQCPGCRLRLDGDELEMVPGLADEHVLRDLTEDESSELAADYAADYWAELGGKDR